MEDTASWQGPTTDAHMPSMPALGRASWRCPPPSGLSAQWLLQMPLQSSGPGNLKQPHVKGMKAIQGWGRQKQFAGPLQLPDTKPDCSSSREGPRLSSPDPSPGRMSLSPPCPAFQGHPPWFLWGGHVQLTLSQLVPCQGGRHHLLPCGPWLGLHLALLTPPGGCMECPDCPRLHHCADAPRGFQGLSQGLHVPVCAVMR